MAAETIKNFFVRLGFDVDSSGMSKFGAGLADSSKRVLKFAAGLQAAYGALAAGVYKFAEAKSHLLALSESAHVTVADLQELQFVAEQTGGSAEALNTSVQGLAAQLAGATIGSGGLETFHRLGISVKDANGNIRSTVDVLMEVGDKIKGMDRAKADMFLGQLGIDKSLYHMLTDDISGTKAAYQEMYRSVGVDADKAAEHSRAFVGQMRGLWTMIKLVADAASMLFIDQMGTDVGTLRQLIQDNVGKIMPILKGVVTTITRSAKFFGTLAARLIGWFSALDGGTQKIILGVLAFAAAWRYLNLAFLASPIGMIITGLIALIALIDDFMTWREGGDAAIDWGPWAKDIENIIDLVSWLLGKLGDLWGVIEGPLSSIVSAWADMLLSSFEAVFGVLFDIGKFWVRLFTGDFTGALDALQSAIARVCDWLQGLWAGWDKISDGITGVVSSVVDWFGDDKDAAVEPPRLSALEKIGATEPTPRAAVLGPPSPAVAASGSDAGKDIHISNRTNITVAGGNDPDATARAVGRSQDRVNADLVRHTRGAVR